MTAGVPDCPSWCELAPHDFDRHERTSSIGLPFAGARHHERTLFVDSIETLLPGEWVERYRIGLNMLEIEGGSEPPRPLILVDAHVMRIDSHEARRMAMQLMAAAAKLDEISDGSE